MKASAHLFLVVWLLFSGFCVARTITVDDDGPADFPTIQAAIDDANDGDTVLVSPGVYDAIDFKGKNIVVTSTDPADPAIVAETIILGQDSSVVTFSGTESAQCVLSGFKITDGAGTGSWGRVGGGILGNGTQASIKYNQIVDNIASGMGFPRGSQGGGLDDCDGLIEHNLIAGNGVVGNVGGAWGGGLSGCDGVIQYNVITGNCCADPAPFGSVVFGAGLAYCEGLIQYNVISNNSCSNYVGPTLLGDGGGLAYCEGVIRNNVIFGNAARNGPGIYNCNGPIENCIIWKNGPGEPEQIDPASGADVSYCNVQGGYAGTGNIDIEPYFVREHIWFFLWPPINVDFGDYHLQSQAGRWDVDPGLWVADANTSPCIDAGNPAGPVGNEPFPNGGVVNMGAYGSTAQASKSYFGQDLCDTIVAGDINGDCVVDFRDMAFIALHWLVDNR